MQEMLPRRRDVLHRRPITVDTNQQLTGPKHPARIVNVGNTNALLRVGLRSGLLDDLYHRALRLSWGGFFVMSAAIYFAVNIIFACLYLLRPGSITNATPGSVLDAFFFSVETLATIGYGYLAPATVYANVIMTVETLFGIMLVALTTGIMFARVSRPTARVLFSRVAVIAPQNGVPTLMVRMANERRSQILQADVTMTLIRNEQTQEGQYMRRFYDLRMARDRTPIFAMSFLAMHPLEPGSPLFGSTPESLRAEQAEILVTVSGLDETMSQIVHARTSYVPDEILFGHRYADIFGVTDDGRRAIDYGRFHNTVAL